MPRSAANGATGRAAITSRPWLLPIPTIWRSPAPRQADASAIVALCSQCHSPRDPDLPMSPGAAESVRFQGTTFTWSRCYTESRNTLDCVTCHDPHHDVETATGSVRGSLPRLPFRRRAPDPTTRRYPPPTAPFPARDRGAVSRPTRQRLHRLSHAQGPDPDGPHRVYRPLHPRSSRYGPGNDQGLNPKERRLAIHVTRRDNVRKNLCPFRRRDRQPSLHLGML